MKKGAGRKMVQSGSPKRIWDYALEFEAYVMYLAALCFYMIQVEVPETVMLGGTSYISQFCEHGFYDWFMFMDEQIQ